jgi:hypothetical protein
MNARRIIAAAAVVFACAGCVRPIQLPTKGTTTPTTHPFYYCDGHEDGHPDPCPKGGK